MESPKEPADRAALTGTERSVRNAPVQTGPFLVADRIPDDLEYLATRRASLSWGFDKLDATTAGIGTDLIVIGVAPGMGKSTFGNQVADSLAHAGQPVLVAALDQGIEAYRTATVARLARVDSLSIRRGRYGQGEEERVRRAVREHNLRILPRKRFAKLHGARVSRLADAVAEFREGYPEGGLLLVDALHNLRPTGTRYTTRDSLNDVLEEVKEIQHKHRIAVILLAHQSRAGGTSTRYPAGRDMGSLSDSNRIEYDADVVILLEPADPKRRNDPKIFVRVRVVKSKIGLTNELTLLFRKPFALFEEVDYEVPGPAHSDEAELERLVAALPGPETDGIKAADIAGKTGMDRKAVNELLKRGRENGKIEALHKGKVVSSTADASGKHLTYRSKSSTSPPPDLPSKEGGPEEGGEGTRP